MKTFKNNKAFDQRNQFEALLLRTFDGQMNRARIKFCNLFILALCKVQNVCFEKLATGFDSCANRESSLRRIQRIMSEYVLDHNLIARLIFSLLPHEPPYTLAMDRTDWKFGKANINILMLAIVYKGVAFPVLFRLTNKAGSSSTNERIELMQRHIDLIGAASIESLVADREFVGKDWIGWLNDNSIRYHIRCKERWQIECAFKSLKFSGFNIENTHLTSADRLEKLFSLVIIAFTWAYLTGIYIHENLKPIRILKHGYKAKTFFKYGLDAIATALLNPKYHKDNICFKFL